MGRKNKLKRFADLRVFPNVYENYDVQNPQLVGVEGQPVARRGQWKTTHFGNELPLTLELACGGGEYTVGLAARYPQRNFMGVDIKGARIWKGAKKALETNLSNAAFLRTRIELIDLFFATGDVDEMWITFPDPFLRKSKANRRLTSPFFLEKYRTFMSKGNLLHLKTDSPELYVFTLEVAETYPHIEVLYQDDDIYSKPLPMPELDIKTYYEQKHLAEGRLIKYIQMRWV